MEQAPIFADSPALAGHTSDGTGIAGDFRTMAEIVALIDLLEGNEVQNIGQFLAIGERFPFAVFVNNRNIPGMRALNPIAAAYLWQLAGGKTIIHTNFCLLFIDINVIP